LEIKNSIQIKCNYCKTFYRVNYSLIHLIYEKAMCQNCATNNKEEFERLKKRHGFINK